VKGRRKSYFPDLREKKVHKFLQPLAVIAILQFFVEMRKKRKKRRSRERGLGNRERLGEEKPFFR